MRRWLAGLVVLAGAASAAAQTRVINRGAYVDRLHGMWLGQCIANWTGLQTEGHRSEPPFYTDATWGTSPTGGPPLRFITDQDPWWADDDTDIEYVYLHLMAQQPAGGAAPLTPAAIADGWRLHMDPQFIWVSNHRAWELMGRGVRPPGTSLAAANQHWVMIDAQLTTEFFGALCPGMPEEALRHADLPIRTTAGSFAAHAAQYYAVLYSLATQVPAGLSGRERVVWLVKQAREWIPDSSKSADIVDFVLADFEANPDFDDWERTRDRIYERYQLNAAQHGFTYCGWPESSVNFASGVMCLLYGQGDYKRTVQIGTLSGWDSDNATATMGGLLGLMLGYEGVKAQFPGQAFFSDRYWIDRTRNNLPDYLPADPGADDTLRGMAERMRPLVERAILAAGGRVDEQADAWVLPAPVVGARVWWNPLSAEERRSANNRVRAQGGTVMCRASVPGSPPWPPEEHGRGEASWFGNGFEADGRGRDGEDGRRYFFSSRGGGGAPGIMQTLEVEYSVPVEVWAVRLIEGDHWAGVGGWFESVAVEVKVGGVWQVVGATPSEPLEADRPFQVVDFVLDGAVMAEGVRVRGPAGGGFVTACEVDAVSRPVGVLRMDRGRVP